MASLSRAEVPQKYHLTRGSGAHAIKFVNESGSSESDDDVHSLDLSFDRGSGPIQPELSAGALHFVLHAKGTYCIASVNFCERTGCVPNDYFSSAG